MVDALRIHDFEAVAVCKAVADMQANSQKIREVERFDGVISFFGRIGDFYVDRTFEMIDVVAFVYQLFTGTTGTFYITITAWRVSFSCKVVCS